MVFVDERVELLAVDVCIGPFVDDSASDLPTDPRAAADSFLDDTVTFRQYPVRVIPQSRV